MQQTDKYKLNLIEKDDVFSPDPLNENARKLEAAIAAEAAACAAETQTRAAETAALDQRLKVFEAHKVAVGQYIGSSAQLTFEVGFTPKAVFIQCLGSAHTYSVMVLADWSAGANLQDGEVTENGFTLRGGVAGNYSGRRFLYLAVN